MPFSTHRKFTAWVGLLAIWLAVLMPAISQSVQRHHGQELSLSICLPGQASSQLTVDLNADSGGGHPQTDHGWQACAYCGLLAAHMPLAHTVAHVHAGPAWRPSAIPRPATVAATAPEYPLAQPRAPPLLSA